MAIILKTDYRKTLGLPGYSSHSFSASVEVEINNVEDVPGEIRELYHALQQNVDSQIQQPGFIPPSTYGMDTPKQAIEVAQPAPTNITTLPVPTQWNCSDKQQELILKVIEEKQLAKIDVEQLANSLFGKGVTSLCKKQASTLIERLFDMPATKLEQKGARS